MSTNSNTGNQNPGLQLLYQKRQRSGIRAVFVGGHMWAGVASNNSADIFVVFKGFKPIHIMKSLKTIGEAKAFCSMFGVDLDRDLTQEELIRFLIYFDRKQQNHQPSLLSTV